MRSRRGGCESQPTSAVYPMAGAILGTCVGGPVGLLAGVKIGGLAAIGGSIFGESLFGGTAFCLRGAL